MTNTARKSSSIASLLLLLAAPAALARETTVPGDANCDGELDISDAVYVIGYLFLGNSEPPCPAADRPELLMRIHGLEDQLATYTLTLANIAAELEAIRQRLAETETTLTATEEQLEQCQRQIPKPKYRVAGVGHLPETEQRSVALAININGQVVGYSGKKAFLWSGGQISDLGGLEGARGGQALDINSAGLIVGQSVLESSSRAFSVKSGVVVDLPCASSSCFPSAVNDAGHVVGMDTAAVLWIDGVRIPIGSLRPDGAGFSRAEGINRFTQVVGTAVNAAGDSHAFLWQEGGMIDLGTLHSGQLSQAFDINDNGDIVGASTLPLQPAGTAPSSCRLRT